MKSAGRCRPARRNMEEPSKGKLIITGGRPLGGEMPIQGSKNTAFPLIAACLLSHEPCVLENVPDILDVRIMLEIASGLGANVENDRNERRVRICAKELSSPSPSDGLCRRFRGSILFAGALVGRLRHAVMPRPGGDAIGARPLDTHFRALESLGASIRAENGKINFDGRGLCGADITLEESSVTATENAILAAVLTPGRTIIRLAATEPHVQELVLFLKSMGADVRWREMSRLEISGASRLRGANHRINPDELEISSFALLAAATRSEITLDGVEPDYLDAVFLQFKKMGVPFELERGRLKIFKPASAFRAFRVQSGLYPKLGSDHLPPFAVLATQAAGTSLIHDWLYERRLGYISELQKMGADCRILDPHRAIITGPTELAGCEIEGLDIRSGMTMVIAGLAAQGRTVISGAEHLDRGYERLEERLRAIGADIQRLRD